MALWTLDFGENEESNGVVVIKDVREREIITCALDTVTTLQCFRFVFVCRGD